MKSAAAPSTTSCATMTAAGNANTTDIPSTAAMDTTLSTFARRLIAPWRCQLSMSGPKTL